MTHRGTAIASVVFVSVAVIWGLAAPQTPPSPRVNDAALRAAPAADWVTHGRDYAETRYSPLARITTANVTRLRPAWAADLGTQGTLEATPIVSNGVMYVSGAWNVVLALDARTGEVKWRWDPGLHLDPGALPQMCCGPINRGVALYDGKVYIGMLDMRLVALDAETGTVVWEKQTSIDSGHAYSITGAPRVVKGKVIIGNGGGEYGVRGYISAYDAQTGDLAWRFFTVPGNPADGFEHPELEMAAATWTGEWWTMGGGGTAWDGMAYDQEADLLYIGTGNGSPWPRDVRSPGGGDNLFLSSILALRPDTGVLAWHFQEVPGEQWDYTATQPIILADLQIGGRERKVLLHAPKNGFFYVLDRITGEFLSGTPYANVTWATGLDPRTGRPIEAPNARYGTEPVTLSPSGQTGAHNWQPMSYHPGTGLVYFQKRETSYTYSRDPNYRYQKGGMNIGLGFARMGGGAPPAAPPGGGPQTSYIAWDPVAAEKRWEVPVTGGGLSGTLATGGGLVFFSATGGELGAYDARTGEKLWAGELSAGTASPITYEVDGRQYIAIVAGRGDPAGRGRGGFGRGGPGPGFGFGAGQGQPARVFTFALDGGN